MTPIEAIDYAIRKLRTSRSEVASRITPNDQARGRRERELAEHEEALAALRALRASLEDSNR